MHFICNQKKLMHGLSIVQKGVSSKTTLPILKGIYIEVEEDQLKLVATDLELGIEHIMPGKVVKSGSFVVDARLFVDIVRKLPDAEVEVFLQEQNQLRIRCENTEFNILSYNTVDFPELPVIEENTHYELTQELFKNMIRQTVFATAQDETRPILTGVLMEIETETLNMVALDGYRLALRKGKINANFNNKIVIPGKTLSEVNKIMGGEEDDLLKITVTNNHALFTIGNTKLISRLLEGDFINYKQILPKENKVKVKVSTRKLLDSIERASLLAKEGKNNLVKFIVNDEKMIITSNTELGKVHEEILIQLEGEDIEIAFNAKYFIEALKVIDEEFVFLEFTTSLSPGILKPATNDNYTYLVLPVRLATH